MSIKLLLVFAVTEFLLCLPPGPAVLLVVSQGMADGFKSSMLGTAGILTGNSAYFLLSAIGLGTLLLASATFFQFLKWLGIAYLIVTGIRMSIARVKAKARVPNITGTNSENQNSSSLKLFSQGVVTQLANPRAIVFFTALLPQFISPGGGVVIQFLLLGIISIAVEFPVLAAYGWVAHRSSALIPARFASAPQRIAGAFLIGAGVGLAAIRKA